MKSNNTTVPFPWIISFIFATISLTYVVFSVGPTKTPVMNQPSTENIQTMNIKTLDQLHDKTNIIGRAREIQTNDNGAIIGIYDVIKDKYFKISNENIMQKEIDNQKNKYNRLNDSATIISNYKTFKEMSRLLYGVIAFFGTLSIWSLSHNYSVHTKHKKDICDNV